MERYHHRVRVGSDYKVQLAVGGSIDPEEEKSEKGADMCSEPYFCAV